jgi:hypothetical protein
MRKCTEYRGSSVIVPKIRIPPEVEIPILKAAYDNYIVADFQNYLVIA